MAYKTEFGAAVLAALNGRPYRQISAKCDISPAYLADMVQGRVPSRAKVIAFALATGADANELLRVAGYADASPSGMEVYVQGLYQLCKRLDRPIPVTLTVDPATLTPDQARDLLRSLEVSLGEP